MHWYAINTKPRHEHLACVQLEIMGIETLFPRLKRWKSIRRNMQAVQGPLFPGYLFARFDIDEKLRAVRFARGVRKIVSNGATPSPVEDHIIEGIKERLDHECLSVSLGKFQPGQSVQIQSGPLAGLEAVFERELSNQQRIVLLLRVLTGRFRVVAPLGQVMSL